MSHLIQHGHANPTIISAGFDFVRFSKAQEKEKAKRRKNENHTELENDQTISKEELVSMMVQEVFVAVDTFFANFSGVASYNSLLLRQRTKFFEVKTFLAKRHQALLAESLAHTDQPDSTQHNGSGVPMVAFVGELQLVEMHLRRAECCLRASVLLVPLRVLQSQVAPVAFLFCLRLCLAFFSGCYFANARLLLPFLGSAQ